MYYGWPFRKEHMWRLVLVETTQCRKYLAQIHVHRKHRPTLQSLTGKYRGLQENNCNENRDPVMRTGVPCNENRFFPVRIYYTGKTLFWPCTGPVRDCSVCYREMLKNHCEYVSIKFCFFSEKAVVAYMHEFWRLNWKKKEKIGCYIFSLNNSLRKVFWRKLIFCKRELNY